jgi:hypothetical protein
LLAVAESGGNAVLPDVIVMGHRERKPAASLALTVASIVRLQHKHYHDLSFVVIRIT